MLNVILNRVRGDRGVPFAHKSSHGVCGRHNRVYRLTALLITFAPLALGCNQAEVRSIQEKSATLEKQNTELTAKLAELQQKLESLEKSSREFQVAAAEFHTQTSGRLGYLESPSKVVQATAYELVDAEKNKRAAFALSPVTQGVGFVMNDSKGVSRLLVRVDDKGPGALFGDAKGVQRLVLGVPAAQPGQAIAPESSIMLLNEDGKPIWSAGNNAIPTAP